MRWRRLTLRVGALDVEPVSALLAHATNARVSIEPDRNRSCITAYVPADRSRAIEGALHLAIDRARRRRDIGSVRLTTAFVRDEDWATSWKRFYKPSRLAPGLYVAPTWEKNFRAPRGARTIVLDPGMAFGTGQHPTTKLTLRLMLPLARSGAPMLDIGCGSGILAIAAAQRGAKAYASDIDPIAVDATKANFRANGLRPSSACKAAGVPVAFPRAPLITANMTADVLASLARPLARSLTDGGSLVTSGVTRRGRKGVLDAFKHAGLRLVDERRSGEWLAFLHTRPGGSRG